MAAHGDTPALEGSQAAAVGSGAAAKARPLLLSACHYLAATQLPGRTSWLALCQLAVTFPGLAAWCIDSRLGTMVPWPLFVS